MTQPLQETFPRVTRLAPSPTGALHLGNARTFLINWALARRLGWRIVLRVEDLDGPRIKTGSVEQAIEDLRWLGLDWDEGPHYQRQNLTPYLDALAGLHGRGLIYPCHCTRREIELAQSAPHQEDHELRYPGTCRPVGKLSSVQRLVSSVEEEELSKVQGPKSNVGEQKTAAPASSDTGHWTLDAGQAPAWRLLVPDEPVDFEDQIHGSQVVDVQAQVGDFVVATKAGLPAYQLAVVVDDARQGVTDVARGDDLLGSTGRQIWIYRMLGLSGLPRYWHLPLVLGPDGRRLAKRHGDTRLAWYREQGVAAERIIGLLASWSGAGGGGGRRAMTAREFAAGFDVDRLPRAPVVFSNEDHAWLTMR
jgi:glutamyl-tRNA synthetase